LQYKDARVSCVTISFRQQLFVASLACNTPFLYFLHFISISARPLGTVSPNIQVCRMVGWNKNQQSNFQISVVGGAQVEKVPKTALFVTFIALRELRRSNNDEILKQ